MGYRLGVDLGTTFTAAATERDGRAEVVQLGANAPQIPSQVFAREDGELLVGDAAARRGLIQPDRLAYGFKRRLGDGVPYVLGGIPVSPVELTARLLRSVVDEVQRRQGGPADRIAITHPANWGRFRCDLLLDAVGSAGARDVTLMTEPAAAAVHFASTERARTGEIVAVYDLGGGTFDAAVLRKAPDEFELMGSPDGVDELGGMDFDDAVFDHVLGALAGALDEVDMDDAVVVAALTRLRRDCTGAKEALSDDVETVVNVVVPGAAPAEVRLHRAEFEDMIRPSVARTVGCLQRALESASVGPGDIRSVVMVGGSARIPLVSQMVGYDLGRPVDVSPQPTLAVALGAALLAGGVMPSPPESPTADRPTSDQPSQTRPDHTPPPVEMPEMAPRDEGLGSRDVGRRVRIETSRPPLRYPRTEPPPNREKGVSPPPARRAGLVVGLVVLAALFAFVVPVLGPSSEPPAELVAGQPVDRGSVVWTSEKLRLAGTGSATLRASLLGIPVVTIEKPDSEGTYDLTTLHTFAAGPVGVDLGTTPPVSFLLRRDFSPFSLVPVLLMLFAAAYAESILRRVRRRGARRKDVAGMTGVGAVVGLALGLGSWTLAGNDVNLLIVLLVVAPCAIAGALLTGIVGVRSPARGPKSERP